MHIHLVSSYPSDSAEEIKLQLSGINDLDGAFEDHLYDVYFTSDRLLIVDIGRRKTLCRVATGMAGIQFSGKASPSVDELMEKLAHEKMRTSSILYEDVKAISLFPNSTSGVKKNNHQTASPKLEIEIAGGKRKKFGLNSEQYRVARIYLPKIDSLSKKIEYS